MRLRIALTTAAVAATMAIAPASAAAGIFQQCRDVSMPIPDLLSTEVRFDTRSAKAPPPKGAKVRKVIVSFKITHPHVQDVGVQLISPSGDGVPLTTGRGGSGDDYGTGTDCASAGFTSIFDAAPAPISSGAPPFEGSFKPELPLAALKGTRARGVWKVQVGDRGETNTGVLEAVRLNVESTNPNKSKKKKKRK